MIAIADIMAAAADAWGSTPDDMRGRSRRDQHVNAGVANRAVGLAAGKRAVVPFVPLRGALGLFSRETAAARLERARLHDLPHEGRPSERLIQPFLFQS